MRCFVLLVFTMTSATAIRAAEPPETLAVDPSAPPPFADENSIGRKGPWSVHENSILLTDQTEPIETTSGPLFGNFETPKFRGPLIDAAGTASLGTRGFGSVDVQTQLPFITNGPAGATLMVTPTVGIHHWNAPFFLLPDYVYDLSTDLAWRMPIGERWRMNLGITPGLFTDGNDFGGDAFRIIGRALATYQWSDRLDLTFGAVYLDREDIPAVPAIGFTWTPNDRWIVEANMPRPRIRYRLNDPKQDVAWWSYTSAALGGGQWSVELDDGTKDIVTQRQFALVWGIERRPSPYFSLFVEAGWVFGRRVEYDATDREIKANDSFLFRFGTSY